MSAGRSFCFSFIDFMSSFRMKKAPGFRRGLELFEKIE